MRTKLLPKPASRPISTLSNLLAISGGGDAGAFAAGLLAGWTAHGTRPEFRLVTGVSAGALIAPFAFLGSEYDEVIQTVSTSIGPKDVFDTRNPLTGLASDGMADSEPLSRLVAKYVTPEILSAVAAEYAKGRALYVGTTDLDSGRPVSWNMGAIAASEAPGALELFRKVLIAATSIPGAVSPVMIDVEIDGKHFQEMHVDRAQAASLGCVRLRTSRRIPLQASPMSAPSAIRITNVSTRVATGSLAIFAVGSTKFGRSDVGRHDRSGQPAGQRPPLHRFRCALAYQRADRHSKQAAHPRAEQRGRNHERAKELASR